jgi:hypothetical protein
LNQDASRNPYQPVVLIADKREPSQLYTYCIACNFQIDNNIYYVAKTWAKKENLVVHNQHPLVIVICDTHTVLGEAGSA